MKRNLHSSGKSTVRSLTAPSMLAGFPKDLRDKLRAKAVPRKFSDGQIIQQRGDKATGFYLVKSGQIKIGRIGSDGDFRVVLIMGPGDSYGELAVLGGFSRVVDVMALGDTELLSIGGDEMDRLLAENPDATRELLRVISQQLQEALDNIMSQRHLSKSRQLARVMHTMVRGWEAPLTIPLNQNDLTELLGTSRVTVSKTLADMERKGILKRGYGNLEIFDIDRLRSY